MKSTTIKSLGIEVPFEVPESVEEFDNLAKEQGSCLQNGINNVLYRQSLAKIRSGFIEKFEEVSGITREVEVVTPATFDEEGKELTKAVTKFKDSEKKYFDFALAQLGKTAADFTDLMAEVAATVKFDPSAAERSSGPKKIAQTYIDVAQQVIDAGAEDAVAADLSEELGYEVTSDLESLAAAVGESERRRKNERANELINRARG